MNDFRFELTKYGKAAGKPQQKRFQHLLTDNDIAFPNTVSIEDIDAAFENFVKNELEIVYDGKKLPTINTMSNQRLSMYGQTWQQTDESNNILLNFKMYNRELDVKKGSIVGEIYNIPGHRDYVIGYKAVRQKNMLIGYDVYTVKEPTAVDLTYKVNIVTNKRELVSKFTEKIYYCFNGLQTYIYPRGHAMSMKIIEAVDESDYSLDDRKFYSQGFTILVKGFFLDESDFIITHKPIRTCLNLTETDEKYVQGEINGDTVTLTATAKGTTTSCDIVYNGECPRLILDTINLQNVNSLEFYINEELVDLENAEIIVETDDSLRFNYQVNDTHNDILIELIFNKQ